MGAVLFLVMCFCSQQIAGFNIAAENPVEYNLYYTPTGNSTDDGPRAKSNTNAAFAQKYTGYQFYAIANGDKLSVKYAQLADLSSGEPTLLSLEAVGGVMNGPSPVQSPADISNGISLNIVGNGKENLVCVPLKEKNCSSQLFQVGGCLESKNGNWTAAPWEGPACFVGDAVDFTFLLDGSNSISSTNFTIMKDWVVNFTQSSLFDQLGQSVHVSVVQYSDYDNPDLGSSVKIENSKKFRIISFTKCGSDRECFRTELANMQQLQRTTYTFYGLRRAVEVELPLSPNSEKSRKIFIVLTDGDASDSGKIRNEWPAIAAEHNITIFAVGIGSGIKEQSLYELALSKAENVLQIDSFDELNTITERLINSTRAVTNSIEGETTETDNDFTSAQFGMSTAYGNNKTLVGAVGAYSGSGTVFEFEKITEPSHYFIEKTSLEKIVDGLEGYEYFGYNIVTGRFDSSGKEYSAVGMPRYQLKGGVVIYEPLKGNTDLSNGVVLKGPEKMRNVLHGSYFGNTLLAVDVNGDLIEDLFVSAPLFVGNSYDEGRVFVYLGKSSIPEWNTYEPIYLDGAGLAGGRFGSSMTSGGDMDNDGYNDIIIAAPYANEGKGVIYIYHGSKAGVKNFPDQIITARDHLYSFGFTMQGKLHTDNNLHPDLLIAAPESGRILDYKSRAPVTVQSFETLSTTDVDVLACLENDKSPCIELTVCFNFSGVAIEPLLDIEYNISVDTEVTEKRLSIENSDTSWVLKKEVMPFNETTCRNLSLFIKIGAMDLTTGVKTTVQVKLPENHTDTNTSSILNVKVDPSSQATAKFNRGCGADNHCLTNIVMDGKVTFSTSDNPQSTWTDKLVVKSDSDRFVIKGNISNTGDNSFNTTFLLTYPKDIKLIKIENSTYSSGSQYNFLDFVPFTINSSNPDENVASLQYSSGPKFQNIMLRNTWCSFDVVFGYDGIQHSGTRDKLKFALKAITEGLLSTENNITDNEIMDQFEVLYQSNYTLEKSKTNTDIVYNTTNATMISKVEEIGLGTLDQNMEFEIKGTGFSVIPKMKSELEFPFKTIAGDPIFYLYDTSCKTGSGAYCRCTSNQTNIYNLQLPWSNQTGDSTFMKPTSSYLENLELDCTKNKDIECGKITCIMGNITNEDTTLVKVMAKFRLWTASLLINESEVVTLRTHIRTQFIDSPLLIDPQGSNVSLRTDSITYTARLFKEKEAFVPQSILWIIILSATGGTVLLIIIIIVVYKTGFFERKKIGDRKKTEENNDTTNEQQTTDYME